jgi:1-acyl-sn-glycerol-3-phosphate acyltransferase
VENDPMFTPLYVAIGALSWPLMRIVFRLRETGVEHLPSAGGFVLAVNHTSNFDPWPVGFPLWPERRLRWMAKAELFKPVLSTVLWRGGAFPVRRGMGDVDAIRTAIRVVKNGDVLVMFPEGTRRAKGLRKKHAPRPHSGAARIAIAAKAPLVPAAIVGTDRLSRLGPLRVAYGEPVPLDDLRGLGSARAAEIGTERMMVRINELEESIG